MYFWWTRWHACIPHNAYSQQQLPQQWEQQWGSQIALLTRFLLDLVNEYIQHQLSGQIAQAESCFTSLEVWKPLVGKPYYIQIIEYFNYFQLVLKICSKNVSKIFSCVSYHANSNSIKSPASTLLKATKQSIKLILVWMCQVHTDQEKGGIDGSYRTQGIIYPLSVSEIYDCHY